MIKIVIADVDGCMVREDKTKPPVLEDLDGAVDQLMEIGSLVVGRKIIFSICTNRSLASGLRIVELAGVNGYSGFEGGNVIYDPHTGESYLLVRKDPTLQHLEPVLEKLQEWYRIIQDKILVNDLGIKVENLRRLSDRKALLTFEILPFSAPPVSGQQLWDLIRTRFLTQEISELIEEGKVNIVPSASALDIGLKIDKSYATRHILSLYGFSSEDALGIGDSYHSDLALLAQTRYKGVPFNAGDRLKESVVQSDGYVSPFPIGEGVSDILKHFLKL